MRIEERTWKEEKSSLRFLRYKNLPQELARYGYEFTPKKAMISYGMIVLLAAIFELRYKLQSPYIAAIGIIVVVFSPLVLIQTMKGKYH